MTSFVAKKVAKHILKESAENKFGSDDPYFEYISPLDMNGNPTGKPKKQRRAVPPGLTKREEKVLKKVTRRAYRLDNCFNFCGVRIGWSTIVGIVPALGDLFDVLMALMVFWTCTNAGLPASLRSRMIFNIVFDFALGLVPLLGDVADAFYRANTRNAALLYSHLKARGAARIAEDEKSSGCASRNPGQQHSQLEGNISEQPRREPRMQENLRDSEHRSKSQKPAASVPMSEPNATQPKRFVTADDLARPKPARQNKEKSSGGWLSRLAGERDPVRGRDGDLENGTAGRI